MHPFRSLCTSPPSPAPVHTHSLCHLSPPSPSFVDGGETGLPRGCVESVREMLKLMLHYNRRGGGAAGRLVWDRRLCVHSSSCIHLEASVA